MTSNGLDIFDTTIQTTNAWLDEIMERMRLDRKAAWKVLSAVLHSLRQRLPVNIAAHLGAQLPLLVRGAYYEQFKPEEQPADWRTAEEFIMAVAESFGDGRPIDAVDAVSTVFALLSSHVSEGQLRKVRDALPRDIRALWLVPVAVM